MTEGRQGKGMCKNMTEKMTGVLYGGVQEF